MNQCWNMRITGCAREGKGGKRERGRGGVVLVQNLSANFAGPLLIYSKREHGLCAGVLL